MVGRRTKLTPEVQASIVKLIRDGSYDYQAARANGIDDSTFRRWMRAGERGNPIYRPFCAEVRQARAEARTAAEIQVRMNNPLAWLRYGPGRERPGEPGWTESAKVEITGDERKPLHITYVNGNEGGEGSQEGKHSASPDV
jgi:transposase-like protein